MFALEEIIATTFRLHAINTFPWIVIKLFQLNTAGSGETAENKAIETLQLAFRKSTQM